MALRASWRGFLKVAEVTCPVALHAAVSTSERIALHSLNRETGHRLRRRYVDGSTGNPVPTEEQVKGYEIAQDEFVMLEPEEVAAAVPDADKTLSVQSFIACDSVDNVYFDRPYYLTPGDRHAEDAFGLIREAMRGQGVAALARTVLFRRVRTLLIRPHDAGLIATTLNFDYEVRSAADAFSDVPDMRIKGEMLDLAKHIIASKRGKFDPSEFDDRYEAALAELVKAKIEGRPIETKRAARPANVVNLLDALRESAGVKRAKPASKPRGKAPAAKAKTAARGRSKAKAAAPRRKAG
ncbi:non-homologous end joining protein Ku [Plastoroseomonas hellenica]|uniref:non-homologous end joining protein Ku n=1 Tax=Plastoroseomonas hellenica TaxID=2687306 RepID=UPI001BA8D1DB|nr:Ku protein [Plastoroseomonas hellenica]MBR0646529.1 Ku protein [Plastoroseomonas hellenica]